jgi:gliding motility-associated-like protein
LIPRAYNNETVTSQLLKTQPPMHSFLLLKNCFIKKRSRLYLGIIFSVFWFAVPAFSQITTVANGNATQLVQSIMGKGYIVSNAKLTCPTGASGTFVSTTSNIGIGQGILLTTGSVSDANGPNNNPSTTVQNGGAADLDLNKLSGTTTVDACALEFDLVPSCDELNINYVFASEEYPDFVGSTFNDIFAFFISGPGITGTKNIAIVPNTNIPVTINNVNAGTNSQYFVDNTNGQTVQYNGFTKPLTASVKVIPCSSYHLKMAIADVGDEQYDSGVFIEAGSISCDAPEIISPPACANAATISLCAPPGYTYDWPAGQPGAVPPLNQQCLTVNNPKAGDVYTVNLTVVGGGCPAISKITLKGADFAVRDTFACLGDPKFALNVTPLTTGTYDFKWAPATNLSCTNCQNPIFDPQSTQTYTVTMSDKNVTNCNRVKQVKVTVGTSFTISSADAEICEGEEATLTVTGADSYVWQPGNLTGAIQKVSPATTTTYTITGTSLTAKCPGSPTTTATVTVRKKPIVTTKDITICKGELAQLNGTISGGASKGSWTGGAGVFTPDRNTLNASYALTAAEEAAGTITLTLESEDPAGPCVKASQPLIITIIPGVTANAGPDQLICIGGTAKLAGSSTGPSSGGNWSGGAGTYAPSNTDPLAVYTPSAAEQTAGTVKLKYTVQNATSTTCSSNSDEMIITIEKLPIVSAGDPTGFCEDKTVKLHGTITGGSSTGIWSGGSGTYNPSDADLAAIYQPSAAEIAAGQVTLILTSKATTVCPAVTSQVTYPIYPNPLIRFAVDKPKDCIPHCVNFLDSTTAGSTTISTWEWDFGNGKTGTGKIPKIICYDIPGVYDVKLMATSDKKCTSTIIKQKMIETYRNPVAAFTSDPTASVYDPTIHFYDQSTTDIKTWTWNLGDGTSISPNTKNPVHIYPFELAAVYTVKLLVSDVHGCLDSIEHPVEIVPDFTFYIPNAFTPSDENKVNDLFMGKGIGIVEYHLWIFDRWGNTVFDADNINKGWDGHAKQGADISQQDVFVWKVHLKDVFGKGHTYIGTVTLVK